MLTITATSRRWFSALAAIALTGLVVALPAPPAQAESFAKLSGQGSSFAAPAIDQWSGDVARRGIGIDYTPSGSAAGRQAYIINQADFAGSDIQYLSQGDPFGGGKEATGATAYSFIPIVAGGTSFPYNLKVGNRRITDLRLSGLTLAKIFTGAITNWADPAIARDYGAKLPSQPITVVTRSDGSGASYQFTRYLSKQYRSIWDHFCATHNGPKSNCGPTQFYPGFRGAQQRNGSDQVANFVGSETSGEGSIAYNEYAYALARQGQPVVKVLNSAGYYSLPTASNVAVALQKAQINENEKSVDFLIQNLDKVYGYTDPRTYPISSYSYLVVPRDKRAHTNGPPERFNNAKGRTLSTWLNYVLCGAQQSAGQLGYSPLPKNLVLGGFKQVLHIPGHVGIPNQKLTGCNNPTYSDGVNHLIKDAPNPSPCDKAGAPLNCAVRNGRAVSNGSQSAGSGVTTVGGGGGSGSGGGGGASAGGGGGAAAAGGGGTGPSTGAGTGPSGSSAGAGNSLDGVLGGGGGNGVAAGNNGQQIYADPVSLNNKASGNTLFSIVTAVEILAALLVPALFGTWLQRRRRG